MLFILSLDECVYTFAFTLLKEGDVHVESVLNSSGLVSSVFKITLKIPKGDVNHERIKRIRTVQKPLPK